MTCSNLHLHCISDNLPGCSCPQGEVINELNNSCVYFRYSSSIEKYSTLQYLLLMYLEPDPCKLLLKQGSCIYIEFI